MNNKLVMISIAAVIGIIVLGSVLMPIMNDATATTDKFTNDGYFRMSVPTDEYVITYAPSVDGKSVIGINGEKYDLASSIPPYASRSIAFAENYIVRMFNDGGSGVFSLQLWNAAYVVGVSSSTFTGTLTITIDDGTLTWVNSATESTTTYSYTGDMICIDPNGDMILKKADSKSYVLKDSTIIYGGGISLLAGTTYSGIYLEGTVEDYDVTVLNQNVTVSDKSEVYSDVDGYVDLVQFEKFTFNTTYNGNVASQTYSYVVVPYEVDAERSIHFTPGQNAIFAAIPVMIILAVLLGVVALVIRSRMD